MQKRVFEKVNDDLYVKKLENGINVYLYPNNNTKNFYISISVKYGAKVNKYKKNSKVYTIIPGSAHFLEHKVMALSENPKISKRINELGSLANAWTSYYGTNYNIFGSINIEENLKLLLDIFYNIDINDKCVEDEKGIIGEEIDMYDDQINSLMYSHLLKNIFNSSYAKNTVVGTRKDIEKITAASLNRIYNDFYVPNNTFIIVCGNFNVEDIMDVIEKYMEKINLKAKKIPTIIKEKEKESVSIAYEEMQKETQNVRVKYALKIPKKLFNFQNETLLKYYLNIILSCNFSSSSKNYEEYKNNNIIYDMNTSSIIIDDYVVVIISAICKDSKLFLECISNDIKKLKITKTSFERKKKMLLKSYILDFDNIEDVEYNICNSILMDNKVNYKEYTEIYKMDYKTATKIMKKISSKNISILTTIN